MKYCPKCSTTKDFSEFRRSSRMKDGRDGWCKICRKIALIRYYNAHPEAWDREKAYRRKIQRAVNIKKCYGMSLDQYSLMYQQQKGCCAMCEKHLTQLFIDHDHATDLVRGLLCGRCNISLGHYEKVKHTAPFYLAKHEDSKRVAI